MSQIGFAHPTRGERTWTATDTHLQALVRRILVVLLDEGIEPGLLLRIACPQERRIARAGGGHVGIGGTGKIKVMPTQISKLPTHRVAYAALVVLLLVSLADWMRNSLDRIDEIRHGEAYARQPFDLGDFAEARTLRPEAEVAGVSEGDVVAGVEGRQLKGVSDYYAAVRRARTGDRLHVDLRGQGNQGSPMKHVSIKLQALQSLGFANRWFTVVLYPIIVVAMPLFCVALGFWVAAVRVGDGAAWLLLGLMLCISTFTGTSGRTIFGRLDGVQPLFTAYRVFFSNLVPTTLALFAIAFPTRLAFDQKYPWVKWIVLGPLLFRVVAASLVVSLMMHHLAVVHRYWNLYLPLDRLNILHIVALIGFLIILARKTVAASDRDARRRLLLLVASGVVSFVPAAVTFFLVVARGVRLERWATVPLVMMLIFPLTMAYVIVVHRAMDVRVVVRQGLQYALTRGGVRIAQFALSALVIVGAAGISADAEAGLVTRALLIASGLAAVLFIGRFAERLGRWVDRRFFRDAYEADEILSDLANKVRTIVKTGPLLQTVATRIAESLHVPQIAILLDDSGMFRSAYALGYQTAPAVTIPVESLTVTRLRKQTHALACSGDAGSWVWSAEGVERESLAQLKPELLLPLTFNNRLLGIVSLGAKQSEEPFSGTDIRLLNSVAAQTGLALENSRLTAAIAAEVEARAKERRDLEIAREVQERFFPQEYAPIAGLDYAGRCRPARGVGGDYYDFMLLPDGRLGIAIGDVSGKGMPAALLMATLRAYVRGGQTIHHQADLTEVMRNLNKLVYESSAANRYATLFYAEIDPSSRALTYVNAGHNPPILCSGAPDGGEVARLECGGPVIGLMEHCVYQNGGVTLKAGDVLVAYTDGVTEAMNNVDEEWGEQSLVDTVNANRSLPAELLMERVITAADAFAVGATQHDDMTIIVVRVL